MLAITFLNELGASDTQTNNSLTEEVVVVGNVFYQERFNALKTSTVIIDFPHSFAAITDVKI